MFTITQSEEFGREVTATEIIQRGDVITECEILVLSDADTITIEETNLRYYTFKYNSTQDCLVLGCGEIFNHSDTPNVSFKLVDLPARKLDMPTRKVMQFVALSEIRTGQQLFIDYASDVTVNANEYINNKSLMGI